MSEIFTQKGSYPDEGREQSARALHSKTETTPFVADERSW